MLPPTSPAFTYSLLPVPVAAETFTDKEPTLLNLKTIASEASVKDKLKQSWLLFLCWSHTQNNKTEILG